MTAAIWSMCPSIWSSLIPRSKPKATWSGWSNPEGLDAILSHASFNKVHNGFWVLLMKGRWWISQRWWEVALSSRHNHNGSSSKQLRCHCQILLWEVMATYNKVWQMCRSQSCLIFSSTAGISYTWVSSSDTSLSRPDVTAIVSWVVSTLCTWESNIFAVICKFNLINE